MPSRVLKLQTPLKCLKSHIPLPTSFFMFIFRGRVRVKSLTLTGWRNLRKEVRFPSNQSSPVQDFEPLQDHGEQGHVDTEIILDGKSSNDENEFKAFTASLDSTLILKNIHIALECPEWKNVVMEEMRVFKKNKTWHTARLVTKEFTQTYGVNYSETFSSIAKLNTIRVLLSVAVNKNRRLYQLDIKNVFLNGDLEEEVYMSRPPGFEAQFSH
ncbi:reverse transcriptase [Cucumis melo var. makuwa]|uniref:Reverse transcriptase n=1 Tax=Cucumis melo var. makuwa TaxID=1194695 RepID=A0A5A7TIZ7_CUCMM|nr:reverse transcriptase [Cucumis melo var. makuwa]TYK17912.1 reverse transcriptase [Cucumis melo var. makuwa]